MTTLPRAVLLVAPLLVGSGAGAAWLAWSRTAGPGPPAQAAVSIRAVPRPEATPRVPQDQAVAARPMEAPSFDIARIGASGRMVAAGRGAPGSEVVLLDGGRELGRARADARGEWVILPEAAVRPGTRELSLRARLPDGQERVGEATVLVVMPDAAPASAATRGPPPSPLAAGIVAPPMLLPPPDARLASPRSPSDGPAGESRLGLDVVEHDSAGGMRFAGSAPPGAALRLYADDRHLGETSAGADGRWSFSPVEPPAPGRHRLRVDQIGAGGTATGVGARVEVSFLREASPGRADRLVVQPGHNLWRIARETYGRGTRFALIFAANREQLRDPHVIYPGQLLALPAAPAVGAGEVDGHRPR